jgi:molybdopterin converting factor small subunit
MVRGHLNGEAVKVLFYGRLADAIGPELTIEASGCSIAQLRDKLIADHPSAKEALASERTRACVGEAIVHDHHIVERTDTVEFLPPVSGG